MTFVKFADYFFIIIATIIVTCPVWIIFALMVIAIKEEIKIGKSFWQILKQIKFVEAKRVWDNADYMKKHSSSSSLFSGRDIYATPSNTHWTRDPAYSTVRGNIFCR